VRNVLRSFLIIAVCVGSARAQLPIPSLVWCTNCSNELTQLSNNAQLVGQLVQQVQMLQRMIKNMVKSPTSFGGFESEIQELATAVSYGQGLAYSAGNIDRVWSDRYPGYRRPVSWQNSYGQWAQTSLDTIVGAMRGANRGYGHQMSAVGLVENLRGLLSDADGHMKAMMISANIADAQTQQLSSLRSLMEADIQSKAAYESFIISRDSAKDAADNAFFTPAQPVGDHRTLGLMPNLH